MAKKSLSMEALVFQKHIGKVDELGDCLHLLDVLRDNNLITAGDAMKISSIGDKSERNRKLYQMIVSVVDESNFNNICNMLQSEGCDDLVKCVVQCYSVLSVITKLNCEELNLEMLIQNLTKENHLSEADNKQINKHKLFSKSNRKQAFIEVLSMKPMEPFLHCLNKYECFGPLLMQILNKKSDINNDISFTRLVSSDTIARYRTYSSLQSELESRSVDTRKRSMSCPTPKIEKNAFNLYQHHLKVVYKDFPELSNQGRIVDKGSHFINVTIVMSLEEAYQSSIYSTSTIEILQRESAQVYEVYNKVYEVYNKIFDMIDGTRRQVILIEGNAGTGKTTLAFNVCKEWAKHNLLKQFSHVILIKLREQKCGMVVKPEDLFDEMGRGKVKIFEEMVDRLGNGILFWLEGWDELDDVLKFQSVFSYLLQGKILPNASIVVTTRPSATGSLKEFRFAYKLKLLGFVPSQVEEYVKYYFASDSELGKRFLTQLKGGPCLAQLAEVPLNLAILVRLFKKSKKDLPTTFTATFHDFLINCLQHHKEKTSKSSKVLRSLQNLPDDMQPVFDSMCQYAFDYIFRNRPLDVEDVSRELYNSSDVPWNFDGLGLFEVGSDEKTAGECNYYVFLYKPIQELLAAVFLSGLTQNEQIQELIEILGNKSFEMVWVLYAGITKFTAVPIESILEKIIVPQQCMINQLPVKSFNDLVKVWKDCYSHFLPMTTSSDGFSLEFLLTLIWCCYEAKNSNACKVIADHFYSDNVCRIEIPPNRASPYLLLAVSYFISHSGKFWSLRCSAAVQSGVELLIKYIVDPKPVVNSGLWVWCFVVTLPEVDTFCEAIKSQPYLQWIHLLNGSCLGDDGTTKLCECLKGDCLLIRADLVDCGIGSKGLKSIADVLTTNSKLLHIDLRKNCFSLEDVVKFLNLIKKCSILECLLIDREFCESCYIKSILNEINLSREKNNAPMLVIKCEAIYLRGSVL